MKQVVFIVCFFLYFCSAFGEVEYLKYHFSVFGIRAGEATMRVFNPTQSDPTTIRVVSKVKTYSGVKLFVNVNDTVTSIIDSRTLRTLRRNTLSVGNSLRDTNTAIFDRDNREITIESVLFGKILIHNTNDSVNDLATEILRSMNWKTLPSTIEIHFLEITNTRYMTLVKQDGAKFYVKEIKDAYVEFTNINDTIIFYRANIPVFYLFPFGNIGLYVELSEVKFRK